MIDERGQQHTQPINKQQYVIHSSIAYFLLLIKLARTFQFLISSFVNQMTTHRQIKICFCVFINIYYNIGD